MVARLWLIFLIQWMLLLAPRCDGWRCRNLEMPDSPIRNLTLNQRKMELSWVSSMKFTKYSCSDGNVKITVENTTSCKFEHSISVPLHNGANFSVTAVNINTTYTSTCTFVPQGMPGTAITNFSCVIYNVSLMNCTWCVGRDAPGDTQYFLYWQNSREEEEKQCKFYVKNENGRNIGCHFQNVTMNNNIITYFIVNGSSKDSLIRFYDEYISLYKIEKFMPPLNVTANCDGNQKGCLIQWQQPKRSRAGKDYCFQYEVNIKYKDNLEEGITSITEKKSYLFQNFNSKKRYRVKVRAAGSKLCLANGSWGEWSAPLEFGNEEIISPSILALVIASVAVFLVAILTIFFCKRTGCWKAAFPQIPEPKNTFRVLPDTTPEIEYKMQSITTEPKEIILVAELVK